MSISDHIMTDTMGIQWVFPEKVEDEWRNKSIMKLKSPFYKHVRNMSKNTGINIDGYIEKKVLYILKTHRENGGGPLGWYP